MTSNIQELTADEIRRYIRYLQSALNNDEFNNFEDEYSGESFTRDKITSFARSPRRVGITNRGGDSEEEQHGEQTEE